MADETDSNKTIQIHFQKTDGYSAHPADGVLGAPTPTGMIYLGFFTERAAIPQMVEHVITSDGSLGERVRMTGKEGMVREIQTGVVLTRAAAEQLVEHVREILEAMDSPES